MTFWEEGLSSALGTDHIFLDFTTWRYIWKECTWSLAEYYRIKLRKFFQVYLYNQLLCLASLRVSGMLRYGAEHIVDT